MEELQIDGGSVQENDALRKGARVHFQKLYTEEFLLRPTFDNLQFNSLNVRDRILLEDESIEEDIHACLRECDGDKASGPDGFNLKFL